MMIQEFAEKYYLHDSSILHIQFDAGERKLELLLELCRWMQEDYCADEPELCSLQLCFEGVVSVQPEQISGEVELTILESKLEDNALALCVEDETDHECYVLRVAAASV